MTSITIPDTGMTIEQELDALMQALLAETDNQPDATPEQLAELEREADKLAAELGI